MNKINYKIFITGNIKRVVIRLAAINKTYSPGSVTKERTRETIIIDKKKEKLKWPLTDMIFAKCERRFLLFTAVVTIFEAANGSAQLSTRRW